MKKIILLFLLWNMAQFNFAQLTYDTEWLILNRLGKNGTMVNNTNSYPPYINNFPTTNIISGSAFTLDSVAHPQRQLPQPFDPRAKNDLFVIYSDWTYYNTRTKGNYSYNATTDPFFPRSSGQSINDINHNFDIPAGKTIISAYLSNIYEKDDPPKSVRMSSGSHGQDTTHYNLGLTTPGDILTANHNVAAENDITLIIKNNEPLQDGDYLFVNQVTANNHNYFGDYFQVSNIFTTISGDSFSNIPYLLLQNGSIALKRISNKTQYPYIFINLKPSPAIDSFLPGGHFENAQAVFSISHTNPIGSPFATINESVLASFDPNFIRVVSVCKQDDNNQFVKYHVQFENTGNRNASNIEISMKLPAYFDLNCLSSVVFKVGGIIQSGGSIKVDKVKRELKFIFPQSATASRYDPLNNISSVGSLDFCIKIDSQKNLQDYGTDLHVADPKVHFGNKSFLISEFVDLTGITHHDLADDSGTIYITHRPLAERNCTCFCLKLPDIKNIGSKVKYTLKLKK